MKTEYNIYEVACILADVTKARPCDVGIDIPDWLPYLCEYTVNECPYHDCVGCWVQYLKHMPEHIRKEQGNANADD